MSHRSEQGSSYAPATPESIDALLREMRSDNKEDKSKVYELVGNVVELRSELDHFKSTVDVMLSDLRQQFHALEVELDSLMVSEAQHMRSNS